MRIRRPWLLRIISFAVYLVLRLWLGTLRVRWRCVVDGFSPERPGRGPKYIFAFWHENMLLPAHVMGPAYSVLISQHADGELIAQVCGLARAGTVRGSTTRGGVEAARQLLRVSGRRHLVVTPDGPRGPRRRVTPGLIYLAARTGRPIVCAGMGYFRPWRLRTWDRFALPRPGSLATAVLLPPIFIPPDLERDQLEVHRRHVEEQMHLAAALAEQWAETGIWSPTVNSESTVHEWRVTADDLSTLHSLERTDTAAKSVPVNAGRSP